MTRRPLRRLAADDDRVESEGLEPLEKRTLLTLGEKPGLVNEVRRDTGLSPGADHRSPEGAREPTLRSHLGNTMAVSTLAPAEVELERPVEDEEQREDRPWIVLVWNDPINLMSYVALV